jgi:hypothetical protein
MSVPTPLPYRIFWPHGLERVVFSVIAIFSAVALYFASPKFADSSILFGVSALVLFVVEVTIFEVGVRHLDTLRETEKKEVLGPTIDVPAWMQMADEQWSALRTLESQVAQLTRYAEAQTSENAQIVKALADLKGSIDALKAESQRTQVLIDEERVPQRPKTLVLGSGERLGIKKKVLQHMFDANLWRTKETILDRQKKLLKALLADLPKRPFTKAPDKIVAPDESVDAEYVDLNEGIDLTFDPSEGRLVILPEEVPSNPSTPAELLTKAEKERIIDQVLGTLGSKWVRSQSREPGQATESPKETRTGDAPRNR